MGTDEPERKPPEMSPYVFPALLVAFGLWCFYDGWLTNDPEMLEHALFNKVVSGILIPWGIIDFLNIRRKYNKKK